MMDPQANHLEASRNPKRGTGRTCRLLARVVADVLHSAPGSESVVIVLDQSFCTVAAGIMRNAFDALGAECYEANPTELMVVGDRRVRVVTSKAERIGPADSFYADHAVIEGH